MLQRAVEFLEFANILDEAAKPGIDKDYQASLVCLFLSANFLRISDRYKKPFNPLLCETFELDRWDEKEQYRFIVEQVEHHPPRAGIFGESKKGWIYQSNFSANSTFKINCSVDIKPTGLTNIYFKNTDLTYVITRPYSTYYLLQGHPQIHVSGDTKIYLVQGDAGILGQKESLESLVCNINLNSNNSSADNQNHAQNNQNNQPSTTSLPSVNSSVSKDSKNNLKKITSKTSSWSQQQVIPDLKEIFKLSVGIEAADLMNGKKSGLFGRLTSSKSDYFKLYGSGEGNKFVVKSDNYTEGCDSIWWGKTFFSKIFRKNFFENFSDPAPMSTTNPTKNFSATKDLPSPANQPKTKTPTI